MEMAGARVSNATRCTAIIALRWTPDGMQKRGRPKETWRRTVEKEMKACGLTWETITRQAANQQQWRLSCGNLMCLEWVFKQCSWRNMIVFGAFLKDNAELVSLCICVHISVEDIPVETLNLVVASSWKRYLNCGGAVWGAVADKRVMKWRNLSSPARSIEFFLSDRSSSGCEIDRVLRDRPSSARSIEFCEIDRVLRHRSSYARSTEFCLACEWSRVQSAICPIYIFFSFNVFLIIILSIIFSATFAFV